MNFKPSLLDPTSLIRTIAGPPNMLLIEKEICRSRMRAEA